MKQRWVITAVLVASLFIITGVVFGAVDYFLKIDDVKGEAQDAKHKGEIDVLSWSWGETQPAGSRSVGGASATRVQFRDVGITTRLSKASPTLMEACAMGRHYNQAVLTARKAGKAQTEFYMMKFYDVVVTSYQSGGSATGNEAPIDQFTFNFGKVEIEYKPQKPDGSLEAGVFFKWDVIQNKRYGVNR
jgi:type VI secretion system secreted protein Hcp